MYSKGKADETKKPNFRLEPLYRLNTTKLESLGSPVVIFLANRALISPQLFSPAANRKTNLTEK